MVFGHFNIKFMIKKVILFSAALIFVFSISLSAVQAKVFSHYDAYLYFRNLMGNRWSSLNLFDGVAYSGQQGVYEYIYLNRQISTTTVWQLMASSTRPIMSLTDKLAWYKTEFLKNNDGSLGTRDKNGIKSGMAARFTDICQPTYDAEYKAAGKVYNDLIKGLDKARAISAAVCTKTYNDAMKNAVTFAGLDKFRVTMKKEELRITRDICVNTAYTTFYDSSKIARDTQAPILSARVDAAKGVLDACKVSPLITSWTW